MIPPDGAEADIDPVEFASVLPFAATVERLVTAIEDAGMTVFARIDHAAGAGEAGLAMPPTEVLIYGNPRGGTPLMLAAPLAALDLPLRVLVREDETGRALVAFHPVGIALVAAGVPPHLAARLHPAQRLVVDVVGG